MSNCSVKKLEEIISNFSENDDTVNINNEIYAFVNQSLVTAINNLTEADTSPYNLDEDVIAGLIYLYSNCKMGYADLYKQMYTNLSLYIDKKSNLYSREKESDWKDVLFLLELDDLLLPKWTLFKSFSGSKIELLYELLCVHFSSQSLFVKIINDFFARIKKYPKEDEQLTIEQKADKNSVYESFIFDMLMYGNYYDNKLTETYEDLSDYTYYVLFLNKTINIKSGTLKRKFTAFDYSFLNRFINLFNYADKFFSAEAVTFSSKKIFIIRTDRVAEKILSEVKADIKKEDVFNEILNTIMSLYLLNNRLFSCFFVGDYFGIPGADKWCKDYFLKTSPKDFAALISNEDIDNLVRAKDSIYRTYLNITPLIKEHLLIIISMVLDKKNKELTDCTQILKAIKKIKTIYSYKNS